VATCPLCGLETNQGHLDYFGCVKVLGKEIRELKAQAAVTQTKIAGLEGKVAQIRLWVGLKRELGAEGPVRVPSRRP